MAFIRSVLTKDKFERFEQAFYSPVATTSFTSSIFRSYNKVFNASDRKRDYLIAKSEEDLLTDATDFITNSLTKRWEAKASEEFKNYICSFMVVEPPAEQLGKFPDPKWFFVKIEDVVDAEVRDDLSVVYIIYKLDEKTFFQVDDEFYRIIKTEGEGDTSKLKKVVEVQHGFGFTPCRQFWTDDLNRNPFIKESTISTSLGKLDKILEKENGKENNEWVNMYPSLVVIEQQDTSKSYENEFREITSNSSGDITYPLYNDSSAAFQLNGGRVTPNIKEDEKNFFIGPGSIHEVTVDPETGSIPTPIEYVSPDIANLEHVNESLEARKDEVYIIATGQLPEFKNDQAKNEDQIASQSENHRTVLDFVKDNIESAERWLTNVLLTIRYQDKFEGATVNYGENYLLKTLGELEDELLRAKENGLPESHQLEIVKQIAQKKYENDPQEAARQEILLALEPFPTMSKEGVALWIKDGIPVDETDWFLKSKFPAIIAQWENDNVSVVEFGSDNESMTFGKKIQLIKDGLIQIVNNERGNRNLIGGGDGNPEEDKKEEGE